MSKMNESSSGADEEVGGYPMEPSERLLTSQEVASMFQVTPKTVARWASVGRIGFIRTPGGHRRYRESEVTALLATLTESQRRPAAPH